MKNFYEVIRAIEAMKNSTYKSLFLILTLLTFGVGEMWGVEYAIAGAFNSWSTTANKRTGTGDIEISITSTGTYEFKIVKDGTWYGNNGTMTRSSGAWNFTTGEGNCKITFDVTGTYIFKINNATPQLQVRYPCTVTYDGNGKTSGSVPTDASSPYKYNSTVTIKGNTGSLAKTGYHFAGWNTSASGSGTDRAASSTFSITSNTTLYAKWIKSIYVYNDASFAGIYLYTYNSEKNGGWPGTNNSAYVESLGSNWYKVHILSGAANFIINENSSKQTNDLTTSSYVDGRSYHFVADNSKYNLVEKTLTVTFNMKSHGDEVSSQSVYYNELVTEPDEPSASGYTFGGWYKETGCTNAWDFSTDKVTAATTLYAKWTKKKYTVTVNNDGHGTTSPSGAQSNIAQVDGIAISADEDDGYEFVNWTIESGTGSFDDATDATTTFYPTSNATIQANFRSTATNSLTVAAGTHVGTVTGSTDPVTLGNSYAISASNFDTGYEFDEWTASPEGNASFASSTSASTDVTVSNGSVTVTANAKATTYSITYAGMDGATNFDGAPASYTIESSTIVLGTPSKDHYKFTGWTLGGSPVTQITAGSTGNKTLTANWTKLPMVYLRNTMNWANAYISFYKSSYWDPSNGSGSSRVSGAYVADPAAMTYNSSTGLFEYECPDVYTYTYACFTKDKQDNYGNFYGTEAIYCDNNLQYEKMINVASITSSNYNSNSTKYYTSFTIDTKVDGTGWFIPGSWSSWETKTTEFSWNTSPNVRITMSLSANTNYEFKIYNKGVYYGNTGTYSESGSKTFTDGAGNCTLTTTLAGTYTFDFNTSSKSLSISYPEVYAVSGSFNSWTQTTNLDFSGNDGTYEVSIDGSSTNYEFKILNHAIWYGHSDKTFTGTESNVSAAKNSNNIKLTADIYPSGSYRFAYNKSTNKLGVTYPDSYNVTFGESASGGGATTATANSTSITSNKKIVDGATVVFTKGTTTDGYHLDGWYDNAAGDGDKLVAGAPDSYTIASLSATSTVYAVYKPNEYTITLDVDEAHKGTIAGATTEHTVTYNTATTTIPNRPTAENGYGLDGYYTGQNGAGTKVINGDGTFIAPLDGYTDEDGKWIKVGGEALYAYYKKAAVTEISFSPAAVVEPGATISATPTISPTPTGTTTVCWRVLYDNGNPLDPQPKITMVGNTISFTVSETSSTYKVEAVLHLGSGCSGTTLDSTTANFQVAGDHTVTVQYKCGDDAIAPSTSVTARPLEWSDSITAPEIFGYTFARWIALDGVSIKDHANDTCTADTILIKATYDGKLKAEYVQNDMIYFKNTLGWTTVRVNFYGSDYWNNDNGSGNDYVPDNAKNKAMTRIGETDVWYFDFGEAGVTPSRYVSFTDDSYEGQYFWKLTDDGGANVVYPARRGNDLADKASAIGFYAKTPMFVPLFGQTPQVKNNNNSGKANYYNDGYWTKYTAGTGYTLEIYYDNDASERIQSIPFTSANELMPMTAVVDLEASTTYRFQLKRDGDVYYGNSGTMTYANHGQSTAWEMTNEATRKSDDGSKDIFAMCKLTTNASGNYTFNLSYSGNSGTPVHYCLRMEVDYPIADGDYRLVYSDATQTKPIISAIVTNANNSKDTVSFFIRPASAALKIQQATVNAATGAITWNDYSTITSSVSSLPKDSVYNICLTMNESGAISVENVAGYTGNFYIRTNAAGGSKWDNFRSADHLMTYSEYAENHADYSHYFMAFVGNGTNVKFVVANDYAPNISDTLAQATEDAAHIEENGDIKADANVRFMWDRKDNSIGRAYLAAAKNDGSKFLVLRAESETDLMDENGNALLESAESYEAGYNHKVPNNSIQFTDNENWIYETTVKVRPSAYVKLYAHYHDVDHYYKGENNDDFDGENAIQLMTGEGSAEKIHVIYDFKTDRLVAAWMPSGNIDEVREINADVMFVREHQGDIQQLTFSENAVSGKMGAITKIETAYGVLRFNKWTLNNKSKEGVHAPLSPLLTRYERDLFYVSFPFRVSMNEVFGFGKYGKHWIIEYYDGAERAQKGFWADSKGFWKYILDRKDKFFEPDQGYIIALDLDELGESSEVWNNGVENVELYFPSYGTMGDITNSTVEHTLPTYTCTINRGTAEGDRRIKDSHWNVMAVPTYVNTSNVAFANTDWITSGDSLGPNFLYVWNMSDNSLTATSGSGYTYHAMHAYMVQYHGKVTWTTSVTPASIAARRNENAPKDVEFRLEIQQNDKTADQTFIRMSNDDMVTSAFDFNFDLSKEMNKGKANIYSLVTSVIDDIATTTQTAGNTLPMSNEITIVPLGVTIANAGDYTFAIPAGTSGVGVKLYDNETSISTDLSAGLTYTIDLGEGTHDGRFVLEISPIKQVVTGIEEGSGLSGQDSAVRKVMVDGILYIVKDNKLYDARGVRVE